MAKSREEIYFSDISKTANVSKSISIPNEEFSDDTTPSVAREFLNEVKSTIVTLQHVSSAHQELHKIVKDENFPIVNQVDARVQNFEIQFLKEAAKFVGDFKSLAKEADESLAKHKALELEIKSLLRAVFSQDIMSVVQKASVVDTSNLQTELERTKERFETVSLKRRMYSLNFGMTVTSNLILKLQESKVVKNNKAIAPGMFRIHPFKTSREEKHVPNIVRASSRTTSITVLQPPIISKKDVNSDSNGLSSTGIDNTKTRRPQPRSNTKNDRVPSASKSSRSKNKGVKVEEHHRNLLLYKNTKHMSSACNNIKLDYQNVISKVVCTMCKQCLIFVNHDVCLRNYMNGKTSRGKKHKANVSIKENEKKHQPKVKKTKKVGFIERLASPKPSKPRFFLSSKHMTRNLKLRINFVLKFMGTVHFENDHVAAILGFGQFCDSDLEVAFRRNACFVRNLEGVDLLKGDHSTNIYTINIHEMASASTICLMARASSTKSWLWHQRLSHLNFDTINDLVKNDLVLGLPKFKYHKEHLFPSCEQGKSKRASYPPKPVPNSRQRLHLLHMDLCGPMRIASINGKRNVLVIVDDYSRYTWSPVIIIRIDNGAEFKNQVLKEYFDSVGISHQVSSIRTPQQNVVVERRNQTLVEAARTMLIFSHAPLILWAEAIATASKPGIQSMILGQISLGLDLTYAPSTITTQQPTEGELDLLFEAMYDDYIGGQPSATVRTVLATQEPQVRQTLTTSISIADTAPTPTNSSSQATNFLNTSQDVDELNSQQQHV
nr:hypothetical protein [Tanacetum cinerariifolium]